MNCKQFYMSTARTCEKGTLSPMERCFTLAVGTFLFRFSGTGYVCPATGRNCLSLCPGGATAIKNKPANRVPSDQYREYSTNVQERQWVPPAGGLADSLPGCRAQALRVFPPLSLCQGPPERNYGEGIENRNVVLPQPRCCSNDRGSKLLTSKRRPASTDAPASWCRRPVHGHKPERPD
jgi:hypothetical protein